MMAIQHWQVCMIKAEIIDKGPLTGRESEVVVLIAEGHGDKMIAKALGISLKTVHAHVANIYVKLLDHTLMLEANVAGLNMRCRAVGVMVAKGMLSLSINAIFAFIVLNAAGLDDHAVRVRSGRPGASTVRVRRWQDA